MKSSEIDLFQINYLKIPQLHGTPHKNHKKPPSLTETTKHTPRHELRKRLKKNFDSIQTRFSSPVSSSSFC